MVFTNYKKPNKYKETIEQFGDMNRPMFFGLVRNFISERFKWVAQFLFKNRNNTQTNKHRCFIAFYSDVEMLKNEYGNVAEIEFNPALYGYERPKLGRFPYEMTSRQYRTLGVEYVEFDKIEYIDPSGKLIDPINFTDIYHPHGDSPVFIAAGYRVRDGLDYVYVIENMPIEVQLKFNNIEVTLGDDSKDIYTNQYYRNMISNIVSSATGRNG